MDKDKNNNRRKRKEEAEDILGMIRARQESADEYESPYTPSTNPYELRNFLSSFKKDETMPNVEDSPAYALGYEDGETQGYRKGHREGYQKLYPIVETIYRLTKREVEDY